MQLTYELTAEDYFQTLKACRRANPLSKWTLRIIYVVFACLWSLTLLSWWKSPPQERGSLVPFLSMAFVWVLFMVVYPRKAAHRHFKGMPSAHGTQTLDVTDDGLRFRSALSEWKLSWPAIVRTFDTGKTVAIFTGPSYAIPVPKRAFSDEQLADFRRILDQNIMK